MSVRLRDHLPEVTPRQHEVARLVARGLTNPQIAQELGITLDGAKYHVAELLTRLDLFSRAEIAEWYREEERRRRAQRTRFGLTVLAWILAGGAIVAALLLALAAVQGVRGAPAVTSPDAGAQAPQTTEGGASPVLDTMLANEGTLWSRAFVGPSTALEAPALAAADDGGVLIGATFGTEDSAESVDLGGGELTSAGGWDILVARLSTDGDHTWSRRFGGAGADTVAGIAADDAGGLVAIGEYSGGIDLGAGPLPDGGGEQTSWLARFDSDGATLWSTVLARGAVEATTVAVLGEDVVVAGSLSGATEIGGSPVTSVGASDLFVASFDGGGGLRWLRTVDLDGREQGVSLALGEDQIVIAATAARASVTGDADEAEADLVLVAVDRNGDERWRHVFGGDGARLEAVGLQNTEDGSVVVAANLLGQVDLGAEPVESAGNGTTDVVLARFGADGRHLWSQHLGSEHDALAFALAADEDGLLVSGIFRERLDVGGTPLESSLNADGRPAQSGFLVKLDLDGERVSSRAFGEPRSARDQALLVGTGGDVYASGLFLGLIDLGSGRLLSTQAFLDSFIAKVEP